MKRLLSLKPGSEAYLAKKAVRAAFSLQKHTYLSKTWSSLLLRNESNESVTSPSRDIGWLFNDRSNEHGLRVLTALLAFDPRVPAPIAVQCFPIRDLVPLAPICRDKTRAKFRIFGFLWQQKEKGSWKYRFLPNKSHQPRSCEIELKVLYWMFLPRVAEQ
jgi:hypothetical protein